YPLGLDPNADIFGLFADKKAGITRNVIIGKDGKIVMLTRLFNTEEFNKMVKVIDDLLK
ncbi:MAG: TlpA family protein disulfide reductase, partial [Tannerellaceae bacterium]